MFAVVPLTIKIYIFAISKLNKYEYIIFKFINTLLCKNIQ
jgi:hypothetical protein